MNCFRKWINLLQKSRKLANNSKGKFCRQSIFYYRCSSIFFRLEPAKATRNSEKWQKAFVLRGLDSPKKIYNETKAQSTIKYYSLFAGSADKNWSEKTNWCIFIELSWSHWELTEIMLQFLLRCELFLFILSIEGHCWKCLFYKFIYHSSLHLMNKNLKRFLITVNSF